MEAIATLVCSIAVGWVCGTLLYIFPQFNGYAFWWRLVTLFAIVIATFSVSVTIAVYESDCECCEVEVGDGKES